MVPNVLWVALGGALGSGCRYWIGTLLAEKSQNFPWATFSVNAFGSLALGFLLASSLLSGDQKLGLKLFLTVGLMGGFTTYSTFSYEVLSLMQKGAWTTGATYLLTTLLVCLLASASGFFLGRQFL